MLRKLLAVPAAAALAVTAAPVPADAAAAAGVRWSAAPRKT
ncbi:hypothetical protein [Paractinoplanes ferrugineus]|nr:hypothetical protein [Actinoplanes ferrugineus]